MELDQNDWLAHDFAELAPRRTRGARNTSTHVTVSGATLAARGLGTTALGLRSGSDRPDLIVIDDAEPSESDYSADQKAKLQSKILDGILPMGSRDAIVQLTGTVTMRGSIVHDMVRVAKGDPTAPEWVRAKGFEVHHYPPILDEGTPAERSLWPQRWTVEELRAERVKDPHGFALNACNDPDTEPQSSEGTRWRPELFRHDSRFPTSERVIHADVAVTKGRKSDLTVLVQLGRDASGLRACVERVEWGRWSAPEIRTKIHDMCAPLRLKPLVRIEGNQGGDTWLDSLAPWPVGVRYEITRAVAPKHVRISKAHAHYVRRAVVHAWSMPELEAAMMEYPAGRHDDVPDAIAGALGWAFP